MAHKSKPKERYLKIPYHILNLEKIGICEKVLLAHIYSFGAKGCWQSNSTLAEIFMVSAYTISRRVQNIREYINIKNPKGYYRTMWAKSHPDVQLAVRQWVNSGKKGAVHLGKSAEQPKQNCRGQFVKSAFGLRQNCVTTNNNTIKETTERTTATPSPLPAGGQAPALLTDRQKERSAGIERFKSNFGRVKKQYVPMLDKEFDERRQKQLAFLRGSKISEFKSAPPGVKPVDDS